MCRRIARLAAVLALPLVLAPMPAFAASLALTGAGSWTYQLQNPDPEILAATDYDLLVIDYSRDGTAAGAFSAEEIAALKTKPDGSRRIVLCYLSIGEAEDYRFYWRAEWSSRRPGWLLGENPDWLGNYQIRFWDDAWQAIVYGSPEAYLDAIIGAGFDGAYLDRADAYERDDAALGRPQRAAAMIGFVRDIASYARARLPGFLIVPQNGEELLVDASYRMAIDGFAKEDLLYGAEEEGERNPQGMIRASLDYLERITATGKPVFLAEYLAAPDAVARARADAEALDMVLFIGTRELDDAESR